LIGTELDKRSGAPVALLARQSVEGLSFAGGAFFALKSNERGSLRDRLTRLSVSTERQSPRSANATRDG
jgi:hypothetical protein